MPYHEIQVRPMREELTRLGVKELRTIEDSLVKSLTAVYHGRVKYPEHQTV